MPGYKGHLLGGAIAYGITLGVVLSVVPQMMFFAQQHAVALIQLFFMHSKSWFLNYLPQSISQQQLLALYPWAILCEWAACTFAGALFPDIDIKSKGQKLFYWIIVLSLLVLFGVYQQVRLVACLGIVAMSPMLVNHRGLFHRLWFIILCSIALWWSVSLWWPLATYAVLCDLIFFIAGVTSHLWLDMGFKRMIRLRW